MDDEKKLLIKMFVERRSRLKNLLNTTMNVQIIPKSAMRSEEVRRKGNELYSRKDHDAETHREIFSYYCESISLAPLESEELAQAYGNRSAFLLHIQKYEECIKDIDRALTFAKSNVLKIKLLCRKVECMKKLGLSNHQRALDTAEKYAKDVDSDDKTQVDKLIKKVKACSISDDKASKVQSNKNYVLPQMDKTLDCVSIEYNEEYGRHLIARKNYNPGDFIFSDDLHVTVLNRHMNYTNCNYCLKICWSGIACDYCSWAMFCDEDCKKKAWNEFHDVECSVIPYLEKSFTVLFTTMQISLRMLLAGIKEAGSINELRENLKLVDQCTDIRNKGFYKKGEFTSCSIESVYSLKSNSAQRKSDCDVIVSGVLVVLIALVKHSQLIKNFNFTNIDDLMKNEDLIFMGSLLIKFTAIKNTNAHMLNQKSCHCKRLQTSDDEGLCCARGACLLSLASLINHSCNSNASMLFTEDKKVTIYAVQPIEKNSQIFVTYIGCYQDTTIKDRTEKLEKYNFTCKCEACVKSWPPLSILPDSALPVASTLENKLFNDCINIFKALDAMKMDFDKRDIKKLSKTIVQAKRLSEPTVLSGMLRVALGEIYSRVYGWTPPSYAFGLCSKA